MQPGALVLVTDSGLPLRVTQSDLQQLYGLTSTEARLAIQLTEGKTLEEACLEMGIRRSTGCTHLKRVFKKTRVRRQSELVALLMKSLGLGRLGREEAERSVLPAGASQTSVRGVATGTTLVK